MLRGLFDGPGIWVVLAVVLLLFGATRLPALARSIGQSTKIFRNEMKSETPTAEAPPVEPGANVAAPGPVLNPPASAAPVAEASVAPTKPAKSGKSGKTAKP